ncbi:hypothetical protein MMC12_002458 [Toensbergia leucococca]|nr:hypothetical protein [Toensbergia leucococca]
MFKKKPNPKIKTLSPLRSSDRRKIADKIVADNHLQVPQVQEGEQNGEEQTSAAVGLGALRNSLLPDGSLSARFSTTAGPDLKQISGIVYVGTHPGDEPRVLWIKIEEKLIPTVYTLWRHPQLVPLLHTPDLVLQKLRGGADLMTPGLARGPPFPPQATKGAIVAIASIEKPSVPMVVGICEIDVSSLQQVQGVKGHAVRGQHWDGDEIWAWSQVGKPGRLAPEMIDGWDPNDGDVTSEPGIEHLAIEDLEDEQDDGGVILENNGKESSKSKPHNENIDGENAPPYEKVGVEEKELSTKEIDEIFRNAFIYALHHHRETHREGPHHGLNFPISQSLVISHLVLPFLPPTAPAQASSLQIKKTSWKNAKKFIKALDKQKILKFKDRDGGETIVTDIDFSHPTIVDFIPYKLRPKDTSSADSSSSNKATATTSSLHDPAIGQHLQTLLLYRAKDTLAALFTPSHQNPKSFYLSTELRTMITTYIDSESLVSPQNKRFITLNPTLSNALFTTSTALDRDILAKGSIPRDALTERILSQCTPFHTILHNNETRETAKAKAGPVPKIQIVLEMRSGNKTVTKVSGVEAFYVNPQLLAEELQKACASSTSVAQLAGSSPRNPVMEILVQGPQKESVFKALEKRGVGRGWVEVVDKVKVKKAWEGR